MAKRAEDAVAADLKQAFAGEAAERPRPATERRSARWPSCSPRPRTPPRAAWWTPVLR